MIQDIIAIMGKELREWLHLRGSRRSGVLVLLAPALVFGIMFPLQMGPSWVGSPATLIMLNWMPLLLVIGLIADSIAGERERHTLETLLASRLPDRSILFGKVCAAAAYAFAFTSILAIISLVTVNLSHWEGRILMFPLQWLMIGAGLTILFALLGSSAGVFVSMRASSAREAQQILTFGIIGLVILVTIVFQALPDSVTRRFGDYLDSLDPYGLIGMVMAVLALVDGALLTVAVWRFRRSRMILD